MHYEGIVEPRPFAVGRVFNLSMSGCKIECDTHMKVGSSIGININFSNLFRRVLIHRAVVVWSFEKDFGLDFVHIKKIEMIRLNEIISFLSDFEIDGEDAPASLPI